MTSPAPTLQRTLGLRSAIMLGLGSILGTGVFVSIGIAAGITGSSVVLAIMLAAALATCNALSAAQLAAAHPVSGGTYEYGYRLLAPGFGFTAGWTFLLAKSASAASAALGVIWYGAHVLGISDPRLVSIAAGGLVLIVTILVASGLERSNIVNTMVVWVTLLALMAFILGATTHIDADTPGKFSPVLAENSDPLYSLLQASALMFVAFTGYGRIATLGEEVKSPRKTIPRAITSTLVISAILYIGVALALMITSGAESFYDYDAADLPTLEQAAEYLKIPGVPILLAIGAVTAMLGVLLNLVLGLSRVVLAMSRRRDLPSALSRVNPSGSPVISVIAIGGFIAALTLIGDIKLTWTFSAFTVLVYYAVTNMCALQQPDTERLYPKWVSLIGLLGCLSLVVFIPFNVALIGGAFMVVGWAWHMFMQSRDLT